MKVRELYCELEKRIPASLSCEWDNDGLMCCPDGNKIVKKVLIALDVTGKTVDYAIENKYDLIISHHPLIYRGIKALDGEGYVSAKLLKLVSAGVSVMSFHTRLDAVEGGVNDKLAALLSLKNTEALFEDGIPLGRVGDLDEKMSVEDFAKKVKEILGAPFVLLSDANREVQRVAVVGGNGGDLIGTAKKAGADTFVSGRIDYHSMTDAPDYNSSAINLIEAGHFYTEDPVCEVLKNFVAEIDPDIECDLYYSNIIKAI